MTSQDYSLGRALKYPKPRRKARSLIDIAEKQFEKNFAASLARVGLYSWHVSERNFKGIPDRYIVGGNWCELKAIHFERPFTPLREFRPEQPPKLNRFDRAGDRTWVAILFMSSEGSWSYIDTWPVFKALDPKWSPADVVLRSREYGNNTRNLDEHVALHFGKQFPGYSRWTGL